MIAENSNKRIIQINLKFNATQWMHRPENKLHPKSPHSFLFLFLLSPLLSLQPSLSHSSLASHCKLIPFDGHISEFYKAIFERMRLQSFDCIPRLCSSRETLKEVKVTDYKGLWLTCPTHNKGITFRIQKGMGT